MAKTKTATVEAPPKTATTDFLLVLDRSGSMGDDNKWDRLVEGARGQLRTIQAGADKTMTNRVSVVILDDTVQAIDTFKVDAASLNADTFLANMHPGGGTPLYDAIGTGVVRLEGEDDGDKDHAYLVNIFTDGMENASQQYTGPMLDKNIKRLQETGRWTFTWSITEADLAAAQAVFSSVPASNFQPYHNSGGGMAAASSANNAGTKSYMAQRQLGVTASADFYSSQTAAPLEPPPLTTGVVPPPSNWGAPPVHEPKIEKDATVAPPESWQ